MQYRLRTSRRCDDDVRIGHRGKTLVEPHRPLVEFLRQLDGAVEDFCSSVFTVVARRSWSR
jgi:hypothetical protein